MFIKFTFSFKGKYSLEGKENAATFWADLFAPQIYEAICKFAEEKHMTSLLGADVFYSVNMNEGITIAIKVLSKPKSFEEFKSFEPDDTLWFYPPNFGYIHEKKKGVKYSEAKDFYELQTKSVEMCDKVTEEFLAIPKDDE